MSYTPLLDGLVCCVQCIDSWKRWACIKILWNTIMRATPTDVLFHFNPFGLSVFCNKIMFGLTSLISPHPLSMRESRFAFRFSYTKTPSSYLSIISHISIYNIWGKLSNLDSGHSNICIQHLSHLKYISWFYAMTFLFAFLHRLYSCNSPPHFFFAFHHRMSFANMFLFTSQQCGVSSGCIISSIHNSSHTFLPLMHPCVSHCL